MADESEEKEETKHWREPKRERPQKPVTLPPSSDQEFFGEGAESHLIPTDETGRPIAGRVEMSTHHYVQKGDVIVCDGCPFQHSVALDTNKYTVRDGQIVMIT